MTEFDPSALLRQFRTKTPTRSPPELPPRPVYDETELLTKISQLEGMVENLEIQLKNSQEAEHKAVREKRELNEQIKEMHARSINNEKKMNERLEKLESLLDAEKNTKINVQKEEIKENRPKTPPPLHPQKIELKKPAFSSAVNGNSSRYAVNKQKGFLDLTPLIELYKVMPDFPRPVLKVDFSNYKIED